LFKTSKSLLRLKSVKMNMLLFSLGLLSLLSLSVGMPFWCPDCPDPVYPEYGPAVEREGFCPRNPGSGICDVNLCTQDNHCENLNQKCCPGTCGGLMCFDAVPGARRSGNCPNFWKVPVEQYPTRPINECDIDTDCANAAFKCCGTVYDVIRKCVAPRTPAMPTGQTKGG